MADDDSTIWTIIAYALTALIALFGWLVFVALTIFVIQRVLGR